MADKPAKAAGGKAASAGERSAEAPKRAAAGKPAATRAGKKASGSYILSAPNGPRTVSHKRIKEAVKAVFRERLVQNG